MQRGLSATAATKLSKLGDFLYGQRRSKGSPLWNSVLVGGLEDNVPFLGFVDKIGVAYEEKVIATGYGAHLALVRVARPCIARPHSCLLSHAVVVDVHNPSCLVPSLLFSH